MYGDCFLSATRTAEEGVLLGGSMCEDDLVVLLQVPASYGRPMLVSDVRQNPRPR